MDMLDFSSQAGIVSMKKAVVVFLCY